MYFSNSSVLKCNSKLPMDEFVVWSNTADGTVKNILLELYTSV
ncbi:hypothetical protein IMPR6_690332 [Imperialibacter sp. EC-SDR9]|nr:hypothetical protein IMPERIA89_340332 [Imperialibacter sp. 89]CAD5297787.1 hypothetical protein IMPERIA75_700332 [Imperialibacter sp. 75]VVT34196.1 hypothetical protein IMPR6_690332 [Imperialibacter sp. EC-SDR9]